MIIRPKKEESTRMSWDTYFMNICKDVSLRATCKRRQVGAVIVNENHQIISTGYNGAPKGIPHCDIKGCLREELSIPSGERHELCRGVHAEQNAIIQAAYNGASTNGCVMYCTTMPCSICAKMIINAGITRVVIYFDYSDPKSEEYFRDAGVTIEIYKGGSNEIFDQIK